MSKARTLRLVAVNIVVTLVLLEIAGLAVFYVRHGGFYYASERRTTRDADAPGTVHADPAPGAISTHVLHPYFGYVLRPSIPVTRVATPERRKEMLRGAADPEPAWLGLTANNYGFFAETDYPVARAAGDFIIAVFGGSVGQWFALQGRERFLESLRERGFAQGRTVRVLNFSQAGYKQPQQLQALAYFLSIGQRFDAVINIDGHNEIGISHLNLEREIDASMPGAQFILPLNKLIARAEISDAHLELMHRERKLERRQAKYGALAATAASAIVHVWAESLQEKAARDRSRVLLQLDAELAKTDGRGSRYVDITRPVSGASERSRFDPVLDLWRRSARTMQRLCDASGITYLEIVQPNQYYSKKAFAEGEREIAIAESSRFRRAVETVYPKVGALARELRSEGVNMVSALALFDAVSERIYADTCCHYNQTGNELLAEFVAARLAELAAPSSRAASD